MSKNKSDSNALLSAGMNQMLSQDKIGIDNNDLNLVQQSNLSESDIVTIGRGIQPS